MPSKNSIKEYVDEGYYHLYNRGVEKRDIFLDDMDYRVFLRYLSEAVSEIDPVGRGLNTYYVPKNYYPDIQILAYCLMPNHVHIVLKQQSSRVIELFSRSLFTRYSMYFNKRYNRVGSLFQGRYKAAQIKTDEYLLHATRYVHQNPTEDYAHYPFSSFQYYLGNNTAVWINSEFAIELAGGRGKYQDFMAETSKKSNAHSDELVLGNLALDGEF